MISKITCYGCGTIGCGWAAGFLIKGQAVTMYEVDEARLGSARLLLEKMLGRCIEVGLTDEDRAGLLSRASLTCDRAAALSGAELVIESVPENPALKRSVIAEIEEHCGADTIIASSTSGLSVTEIAAGAVLPGRVVGAHPFNPVYLVPLVEIIKGERTKAPYVAALTELLQSIGKETIVLEREIPGFVANRLQAAMHREARDLVHRGICTVEQVDKAVVYGPGSRWGIIGPHIIFELNGGEGGIRKQATQKGETTKAWYRDMAGWDEIPEGYIDRACEGLRLELEGRSPEQGRSHEELEHFRDKGLAMMLRFHGKA